MTSGGALAADSDDDAVAKPAVPNIYLDLRTTYATIPAGTLGLGFGNTSLSAAFEALVACRGDVLPNGLPAAKSIAVDLQADLYQQNGGTIPTITLQSTLTQSVPNEPGMTTSFNNILEFDYALDEDETRGWLAGVQ